MAGYMPTTTTILTFKHAPTRQTITQVVPNYEGPTRKVRMCPPCWRKHMLRDPSSLGRAAGQDRAAGQGGGSAQAT